MSLKGEFGDSFLLSQTTTSFSLALILSHHEREAPFVCSPIVPIAPIVVCHFRLSSAIYKSQKACISYRKRMALSREANSYDLLTGM